MSNGQVPRDDNDVPSLGLWDSTGHQIVPAQAVSVATDSSGQKYGVMNVNASFSAASLAINDPTTTTQKAGVNAGGSLQVAGQGIAGTPAGGVVSIQGVASGTVVPISGTITANAGTNLNTSLLALETGGNLASAKADLDTVVTNTTSIATAANQTTGNTNTANTATGIGGVADSAYTSGSGSIIAIVKGTFTRLANIVTMAFDNTSRLQTSLYGKNSAAGDTALQLNSDGSQYMDARRVLGSTLSASNPFITEDNIRNWTRNGQAFYASTEEYTPANANNAFSLFNPVASGKTFLLYSMNLQYATGEQFLRLRVTNTNPSFANTLSSANFNLGNANAGSATASVASVTYATAATTAPALSAASLAYGVTANLTSTVNEILTNGKTLALPAGTGLAAYFSNTAAGTLVVSFYWAEL
jgi:hypothetical protein